MSKEQKFHKLIQEQDTDKKEELWNKIENQINNEEIDLGDGVLAKKRLLTKQHKLLICLSALLIVVIIAVLVFRLFKPDEIINEDFRYCNFGDYYSVDSDESISDYSKANSLNLLYFNWFDKTEFYADTQYKMNESDEIICLGEELVDENGYYIYQYITDEKTQIDFLKVYSESCIERTVIKSVEVNYGAVMENSYANFSYANYSYYFKLESTDTVYLLSLLNELIV